MTFIDLYILLIRENLVNEFIEYLKKNKGTNR